MHCWHDHLSQSVESSFRVASRVVTDSSVRSFLKCEELRATFRVAQFLINYLHSYQLHANFPVVHYIKVGFYPREKKASDIIIKRMHDVIPSFLLRFRLFVGGNVRSVYIVQSDNSKP